MASNVDSGNAHGATLVIAGLEEMPAFAESPDAVIASAAMTSESESDFLRRIR